MMEYQETLIPFSDDEQQSLKRIRKLFLIALSAIILFDVALGIICFFLLNPKPYWNVLIRFSVATLLFILVFFYTLIRKINKNLSGGCKKVTTATVKSQRLSDESNPRSESVNISYKI